jgi:hypothetical protein
LPIGPGQAFARQNLLHVGVAHPAGGDDPAIPVALDWVAGRRATSREGLEARGCGSGAVPGAAAGKAAALPVLCRINSSEADALAGNVYGVAVQDMGSTADLPRRRRVRSALGRDLDGGVAGGQNEDGDDDRRACIAAAPVRPRAALCKVAAGPAGR